MDLEEDQDNLGAYHGWAVWRGRLELQYHADTAAALAWVRQAQDRHPLVDVSPASRPYTGLASLYARAGDVDRAKELFDEYQALVPEGYRRGDGSTDRTRGDIAMAEGKYREALEAYRAGFEAGTCITCGAQEMGMAYERLGLIDSAIVIYQDAVDDPSLAALVQETRWLGFSYKRLGELYEDRDRQKALDYYSQFVDLWRDADPELQPVVEEVRARMAELSGEPN
jgi:pentatricopeptide repeat protein